MCPRCGNLRSDCENAALDWHPRTAVCWASATQEWGKRRLQAAYEKQEPKPDELHPLDGRWVWVSTTEPDASEDEFL